MSAVPPIAPETRQALTTARVHRMRVARGACWVIVGALLAGAGLALLDAIRPLPAWLRGVTLAAWLTGFGVLVWRLVARRMPPDPTATARHARTELAGNLRAAAAAALALAVSLSVATLLPGAGEHIRRVTLPWTRTGGPVLYRVKVTAGDPVVRRGDALTLSAYAEKLDPSAATPGDAILVVRDRDGQDTSIPMSGDGTGAFHATRPDVTRGFDYRVDVGGSSSDWHTVFVLDPVEPTGQSTIEIVPPPYAPARSVTAPKAFGPFEAHQYSTATLRLHFSQPAAVAFLEWHSDGAATEHIPVALSGERLTGTASFRWIKDGTLTLVTVAETKGKSLQSKFPLPVRVIADAPPRLERLIGLSPRPRTIRPDAKLGIAFTAIDDIAVGSAVLEYSVDGNDAKLTALPIEFTNSSAGRAVGRIEFELSGKARAGETIRMRLRVGDTRRLDNPSLLPQEATFPESGWSVLRVDPAAPPIEEQDIDAQRDALGEALLSALESLKSSLSEIGRIRSDTADSKGLSLDQTVRLTNARDGVRRVSAALRLAAREAGLTPELQALAGRVGETADQSLRTAEASLKQAATNNPVDRAAGLTGAIDALRGAVNALDQHLTANQRIARARLDSREISALATDQAAVADLSQPDGAIRAEELARLQRELHARLRKLIADSDSLRVATETAKADEVRRLTFALRELAGFVRDLDAAGQHLETEARKSLLGGAAREQGRIVAEATALLAGTENAARLAGCDLPAAKDFVRVAELIESGRTVEALTELETRAQALESAAAAMTKWASDHRDPRLAARQLGAWQESIRTRFRVATKDNPANFAVLPAALKEAFRQEQLALRHFANVLSIPPAADLRAMHKELILHISTGAAHKNPARAEKSMASAIELFNRLSDAIPTIPERLAKSRADFAPLLLAQEAILFEVEQAIRGGETTRKLPALLDRQLRQSEAFGTLDLPGAEGRVAVIAAALAAVIKDLRDGVASEALASQYWLKREFDRLRRVLDGLPAPDDRVEELARKLGALARSMEDLGPSFSEKQLEAFAAEALALARDVVSFGIPAEAPALANDARVAALRLEDATRDAVSKSKEFMKRLRPAADAIARLSARLTSAEPDLDRVRRLAANRWAEWEEARKVQGKALNPDASAEARRQLAREAEELNFTRVGFAAHALKKAVLDQYLRLKDHDAPDRQGGPLKLLAQSLDELAALMADVDELCTPIDRTPRRPTPDGPNRYVPTLELAAEFRALAGRERDLRKQVARVSDEALVLTSPGNLNRIGEFVKEQRELAAAITNLSRQLEQDKDAAAPLVLDAAIHATLAADGLAVGMIEPASGSAERAGERLRGVAIRGKTKPWAVTAADLAARQDAGRARMGMAVSFSEVAAQQKARGEVLAQRAVALGKQFELAALATGLPELAAAAKELATVETLMADATRKAASRMPADAARLRVEAAGRLGASAEKVAAGRPAIPTKPDLDPSTIRAAEALRRADAAMRQALEVLEPNADRAAAEKAMRQAAEALSAAAGECAGLYGK